MPPDAESETGGTESTIPGNLPDATVSATHLDMAKFNFHYTQFHWTIEQFMVKHFESGYYIDSPPFGLPGDSRYRFNLRLFPKGDTEEDRSSSIISLGYVSPYDIEEANGQWRVSIGDVKDNKWHGLGN